MPYSIASESARRLPRGGGRGWSERPARPIGGETEGRVGVELRAIYWDL
jgi:hypothetical protein